jgi:hypothetical protein
VSAFAVAKDGITNPDGYAEYPGHAVQDELAARTDPILDPARGRLNDAKEQG